jgi:predicted MFS family arabinose efflux permease
MLGLLNGCYGGLGQSVGSLVGGALIERMGIERTFYLCAAVTSIILAIFTLYIYIPDSNSSKNSSSSRE